MALVRDHDHLGSILGSEVRSWAVTPAAHVIENMTTDSLDHVRASMVDGTVVGAFAKTLHPASASPLFAFVPPEHHASVLEHLHWLDEPRVYECGLARDLPVGVRLPALLSIDRPDPDRLVLWLEHVDDHGGPWNTARYHRSARALGRLTGRWPEHRVTGELGLRRRSLHYLFFGKVANVDLPRLADDATWDDSVVRVATAGDPELRGDLAWLVEAVPALLDRNELVPHGLAHGDASPANLHEPGDGTVVALDWSYGSSGAVGSDLAQLLAGHFESGVAEPDHLASIADAVYDGFTEGLADESLEARPSDLRLAWATHLAVRSAFSAILVDRPDLDESGRVDLIRRRAALARYAVDLVRSV